MKARSPSCVRPAKPKVQGTALRHTATQPKPPCSRIERVLFLQRTLGNQAVRRLLASGADRSGNLQRACPKYEEEGSRRIQLAPAGRKTFSCPDFAGDAKLEACLNNLDRLRPGESGPSVQKLQRGLLNDDIDIGPRGADGKFGDGTAQGVLDFKANTATRGKAPSALRRAASVTRPPAVEEYSLIS